MRTCEQIEPRLISRGGPIRTFGTRIFEVMINENSPPSRVYSRCETCWASRCASDDPVLAERAMATSGMALTGNQLFFSLVF